MTAAKGVWEVLRSFALMRAGRLELHIGKTFPLAQAAEAHRYLESRNRLGS